MPFVFILYIAGWLILSDKPQQAHTQSNNKQNNDEYEESIKVKARVWQAGEPPKQALHDIGIKFKRLETKLIAMEKYVTSPEFTLSREINKL